MPKLAVIDDAVITRDVWDRIVQTLIFFGDQVTLRASYIASTGIDSARLSRLLSDLHEAELIRFWAHEYEVDDRLRPRSGVRRQPVDLVASAAFLRESMAEIDENLRWNRASAYESGAKQQGIGEIIAFRHMLTSSMVTKTINSNGLMLARSSKANTPFGLPETFSEAVTRNIRETLAIPPLDQLTADQILACRPHSEGFRRLLEQQIGVTSANAGGMLSSTDVAEQLLSTHRDVQDHLAETMRPPTSRTWSIQGGTLADTVVGASQDRNSFPLRTGSAAVTPAHGLLLLNQLLATRPGSPA